MITNHYIWLFNILKISYARKKYFVRVKMPSKKSYDLLEILFKVGYISRYRILSDGYVVIILRYYFHNYVLSNLTTYYETSSDRNLSLKSLKKILKNDLGIIFILSTSKGLITGREALKYSVGGKLVCILR